MTADSSVTFDRLSTALGDRYGIEKLRQLTDVAPR